MRPWLKSEVSRHPTDPENLLVPNSAADSYGWMLDRFQEVGMLLVVASQEVV